jgi:MFS family permease
VKNQNVVRNYYVLPCCLLLLNLCVELVSYKAKLIDEPIVRTLTIMAMVLFGGSFVGFVVAPAIGSLINWMQRSSRQSWGGLGEVMFLLALGLVIFWLYYQIYIVGPESVLPKDWQNPLGHR